MNTKVWDTRDPIMLTKVIPLALLLQSFMQMIMAQGCNIMFNVAYSVENGPFSFIPGECQPFMNSYLINTMYIDSNDALPGHGNIKIYTAPGCNEADLFHEGPTPIDFTSIRNKNIRSVLIDRYNDTNIHDIEMFYVEEECHFLESLEDLECLKMFKLMLMMHSKILVEK
ncbi:hypothetical protein K501DRAFT_269765 [Backusella circina FSU 941]|nr:hypothetical protein K501DRAFT_269765 [Backusella circina FSU 941]